MTLIHRANTTAANVIQNISAVRWDNLTAQWGGYSNNTTSGPNPGMVVWEVVNVYPDVLGPIAWVVLFAIPFVMMWITHADMVPAAIIGIFFGVYIVAYIGSEFFFAGMIMMAVAIVSIVWSLYQKRG